MSMISRALAPRAQGPLLLLLGSALLGIGSLGACAFRPDVEEWQPWTKARTPGLTFSRPEVQLVGPQSAGSGKAWALGAPLVLTNEGAGSLPYTLVSTAPWLRVVGGPSYGYLAAGDALEVDLDVDLGSIPEGQGRMSSRLEVRNSITLRLVGQVRVQWLRRSPNNLQGGGV